MNLINGTNLVRKGVFGAKSQTSTNGERGGRRTGRDHEGLYRDVPHRLGKENPLSLSL